MSRPIKFRAWSKKHNRYLKITGIQYDGDTIAGVFVVYGIVAGIPNIIFLESEDIVLEQDTGLKDKNGKEICEGDIVEEDIDFNSKMTDGTFRYKVYWNEDELCWSLDPIGPESIHNDLWELNSSCRVIGNIHEPPKDFRPEHLKRMGVSISKGGEE